jgi:ABC-2 type transport system permease protein
MNFRIIATDFHASVKTWTRSKGTMFWTILFPVLLILIFGAIFSGVDETKYELHIQDLDGSTRSNTFVGILNNISILDVKMVDVDENITSYMQEKDLSVALVIHESFGETINQSFIDSNVSTNMSFHYDPSEQGGLVSVLREIITNTLHELNMQLSGGRNIIGMDQISPITEDFNYINFFLPGMIGFTIMTTCVYGSIERNTKFRKDGILRKLLTTPITRTEWILSKMLFMMFLSFVSTIVILVVGIFGGIVGIFGSLSVNVNLFMIIIIIATSFMFSGIGMIIGRFVKDTETADMAGGAITFPMMFLAGTFISLDMMPGFMQSIARILPLYYVNEGLRNAMIYMDLEKTILNTIAVLVFAAVFFLIGVFVTKWKED